MRLLRVRNFVGMKMLKPIFFRIYALRLVIGKNAIKVECDSELMISFVIFKLIWKNQAGRKSPDSCVYDIAAICTKKQRRVVRTNV